MGKTTAAARRQRSKTFDKDGIAELLGYIDEATGLANSVRLALNERGLKEPPTIDGGEVAFDAALSLTETLQQLLNRIRRPTLPTAQRRFRRAGNTRKHTRKES